jgi:hypothetical protein
MARNGIQFQKGLSLQDFQRLYGTEELLCGSFGAGSMAYWFLFVPVALGMTTALSTDGA